MVSPILSNFNNPLSSCQDKYETLNRSIGRASGRANGKDLKGRINVYKPEAQRAAGEIEYRYVKMLFKSLK